MATRKDNKGRVLLRGEYQRGDGRYQYSYTDITGKRRFLYAHSLVDLRQKERDYMVANWQGADNYGVNVNLNYIYDRFIATKFGLKESTYASYLQTYNGYVRDEFGKKPIKSIRYSDVQAFYVYLLRQKKLSIKSVELVHRQLYPAFELAVQDGVITKNPTKGTYGSFKRASGASSTKKHAITIEQQRNFLQFIDKHPVWWRYHSIFQVMLGTGMRVGEICGLRWEDVDFDKRQISVNHAIVFVKAIKGGTKAHIKISLPKSEAGIRTIPVMDPVLEAFKEEYRYQKVRGFKSCEIDGYTDFIFTNQNGGVYTSSRLDKALSDIVLAYNNQEERIAKIEKREPEYLPHISNHTLRHTFCTRLCERDVNIKVIQTVMGHSSIKITMDIYAEVSKEKQQQEIARLAEELDVF